MIVKKSDDDDDFFLIKVCDVVKWTHEERVATSHNNIFGRLILIGANNICRHRVLEQTTA